MLVKELIEELKKCNQDEEVMICTSERYGTHESVKWIAKDLIYSDIKISLQDKGAVDGDEFEKGNYINCVSLEVSENE